MQPGDASENLNTLRDGTKAAIAYRKADCLRIFHWFHSRAYCASSCANAPPALAAPLAQPAAAAIIANLFRPVRFFPLRPIFYRKRRTNSRTASARNCCFA